MASVTDIGVVTVVGGQINQWPNVIHPFNRRAWKIKISSRKHNAGCGNGMVATRITWNLYA